MTARAGSLAPAGTHGSASERRAGHNTAHQTAPLTPAARWKMRALNALGAVVTWRSAGDSPDLAGTQYTGGNLPLSAVSVAASWQA